MVNQQFVLIADSTDKHAGKLLIHHLQLPVCLIDDFIDLHVEIPVFVCQSFRQVFLIDTAH